MTRYTQQASFYNNYAWIKCCYSRYWNKLKNWLPKEEAIKKNITRGGNKIKTYYDEIWRVCISCNTFQSWDNYRVCRMAIQTQHSSRCKKCLKKICN